MAAAFGLSSVLGTLYRPAPPRWLDAVSVDAVAALIALILTYARLRARAQRELVGAAPHRAVARRELPSNCA